MGLHMSQSSSKMIEKDEQEEEIKQSHSVPPKSIGIKVTDFKAEDDDNDEQFFKEQLE